MTGKYAEEFVRSNVSHLLRKTASQKGPLVAPLDLAAMYEDCGILKSEYRNMIPEGVLHPTNGGFVLYVQGNFRETAWFAVRERFTIAHEIAHTFFFDRTSDIPRMKRDAPRGEKLEQLCHFGAREILMPAALVERELAERGGGSGLEDIEFLSQTFQVSIDVVLRRLKKYPNFCGEGVGVIYVVHRAGGRSEVRAEFHDRSLLPLARPTKIGDDFVEWVKPIEPRAATEKSGEWEVQRGKDLLRVKKKQLTRWSSLVELKRLG